MNNKRIVCRHCNMVLEGFYDHLCPAKFKAVWNNGRSKKNAFDKAVIKINKSLKTKGGL